MSRIDRLAVFLSILVFATAALVADRIYERVPHIEDEMAYVWQAKAVLGGKLSLPSPEPSPKSFLVPFVVDYQGMRFGKYPPGWPVVLAFGEGLHVRFLVNPFLTAVSTWLLYRLAKKLLDERTALLAAFLAATSPFVLINAGSLISHPLSLFLTLTLSTAWLDAFTRSNPQLPDRLQRALPAAVVALSLGLLALTRPWTAVAVFLPFLVHSLIILVRGPRSHRLLLIKTGLGAVIISSLYFLWQYAVTGSPLTNPYTLWWPYDKIGFGPDIGLAPGGHTLAQGYEHTMFSLDVAVSDLFGWPRISWLFLPFGLWAVRRDARTWMISGILPTLIAAYMAYWVPAWVYGPRYYYEAVFVAAILSAAGMRWAAGLPVGVAGEAAWHTLSRLRLGLVALVIMLLIGGNLRYYLPMRISSVTNLYGLSTSCMRPILTGLQNFPGKSLVFVHISEEYLEYGCLLELNNPYFDTPTVVAISRSVEIDQAVAASLPDRTVWHYYPDTRRLHNQRREIPPKSQVPLKPHALTAVMRQQLIQLP